MRSGDVPDDQVMAELDRQKTAVRILVSHMSERRTRKKKPAKPVRRRRKSKEEAKDPDQTVGQKLDAAIKRFSFWGK